MEGGMSLLLVFEVIGRKKYFRRCHPDVEFQVCGIVCASYSISAVLHEQIILWGLGSQVG